jgi:SpoVK/Ycf46/Vps4 family AAA+-type ATPase
LYVKSFKSQHGTEHGCIRAAFDYARQITPCILVLEDLDSLIDDENRSYFLNEMDGFMSNDGIFVVATTNHPDRLDTAIVDRPSRFDRKYHFELPDPSLRERYMSGWNETAAPELRLNPEALATIVGDTDGFSFAYLKAFWLSSMMRWINTVGLSGADGGAMDQVMAAQLLILREQMTAARDAPPPSPSELPADFAQHYATYVQHAMKRGLGSFRSFGISIPSDSIPDDDAEED